VKTRILFLLPLIALALAEIRAADDPRAAALRAADDERVAAFVKGDHERLGAIFSDDLRYAHSTGSVDTKASFTTALLSGRMKYLLLDYEERNFTFPAPGIALMTGRARVKVSGVAGVTENVLGFLAVWREEQGKWRFLAWQSNRIPPPTPLAK
jgi:hypothetical protein